mmetsp:Transcript_6444/g.12751  ORF Transcript_6444/g.12751 Transcript_6444/m.12751 type:complete len:190 (+) Transcript_6444:113-682(+)|eukprot:CAMPEP_0118797706 /NCGR_PEP_ID=MMETSP1161-20130426/213_1 /TAXON_ID=249345 /ORGANISM="Picochlorum oklahomensis, Strain CCMP2329" /LENGTH=189 /DNA_ID=CAMNT_0006724919 /DNA_START=45 /DNA_END=614 /DNA_ORIENTATION=-
MKVPTITWDPKSLRRGIWNNTWKNWGYIALAFLFIYAIEAGFFAGLLFTSKRIREQTYRALPSQYFGDFIRTANVYEQPAGLATDFNPPENCVEGTETVPDFPDVTQPNGIQTCFPSKGQLGWVIFPWVQDSAGLDTFPGCTATPNATVITFQSNPAFTGDGIAQGDWQSQICQNFLLTSAFVGNAPQA